MYLLRDSLRISLVVLYWTRNCPKVIFLVDSNNTDALFVSVHREPHISFRMGLYKIKIRHSIKEISAKINPILFPPLFQWIILLIKERTNYVMNLPSWAFCCNIGSLHEWVSFIKADYYKRWIIFHSIAERNDFGMLNI